MPRLLIGLRAWWSPSTSLQYSHDEDQSKDVIGDQLEHQGDRDQDGEPTDQAHRELTEDTDRPEVDDQGRRARHLADVGVSHRNEAVQPSCGAFDLVRRKDVGGDLLAPQAQIGSVHDPHAFDVCGGTGERSPQHQ